MLSVLSNIKSVPSIAAIFAYSVFYLFLIGVVQNFASMSVRKVIKIHTALM